MPRVVPRRSLDELALKYRINPSIGRDIFVEGLKDKRLIEWYLREREIIGTSVFTIDTVDVPDGLLIAKGLDPGSARNRVVALRAELASRGADVSEHLFVADRDQEDVIATPDSAGIYFTDCGALSTHLFEQDSLAKLVGLIGGGNLEPQIFRAIVLAFCREIYLVRAAAKMLGVPLRILSPEDHISGAPQHGFAFDRDSFLARCANSCGLSGDLGRMNDAIAEVERQVAVMNLSDRVTANDHDLLLISRKIMRLSGVAPNCSTEDIRNLLYMGANIASLRGDKFFMGIG